MHVIISKYIIVPVQLKLIKYVSTSQINVILTSNSEVWGIVRGIMIFIRKIAVYVRRAIYCRAEHAVDITAE